MRSSVVLPQPEGPSTTNNSPAATDSDDLQTAGTPPKLLEMSTNSIMRRLYEHLLIPSRHHIVPVSQIAVVGIILQCFEIFVLMWIDAGPERIAARLRGGHFGDRAGKTGGCVLTLERCGSELIDELV